MATNTVGQTLSFLTDAGHLLAATVPQASAYLLSRRNELMFEHEMPLSDQQRQRVCTCCGHIMLLGQGSLLQVKAEKRVSKKPSSTRGAKARSQPRSSGPTKAIACAHCGRQTEVKLPPPAPISRRRAKVAQVSKASGPGVSSSLLGGPQQTASQRASANASSKKRAKSRKAGLLAMLDQSNAARGARPGLGLSLADFMEKK
ncbi:uncharacterized protein THITE_2083109 [Thermothielavioides terrestris NRRL 8126]|uniref:Uncharacterized protein n=1 Tax=Thermothielavioides terrestris (strain ATCC 38088 / NRRL 8126) TaxID=578455 RepID=G2RI30_THETT|nr:uncharacterized protein THITE_2083109 [Thermothielavioides terrestris NRRL 8126]AEO71492.1 hypothetical protein THITE_2083109 [Thermothielavioides terrestris NRRL 8126]